MKRTECTKMWRGQEDLFHVGTNEPKLWKAVTNASIWTAMTENRKLVEPQSDRADTGLNCVRNKMTISLLLTTLLPESFLPMAGTGTLSSKQRREKFTAYFNKYYCKVHWSKHTHTHIKSKNWQAILDLQALIRGILTERVWSILRENCYDQNSKCMHINGNLCETENMIV